MRSSCQKLWAMLENANLWLCLSTNYSIIMGGLGGKITMSIGLRQGDPLSLFLFILIVDWFWEDPWIDDRALKFSFPRICNIITTKESLVYLYWSESSRDWLLCLLEKIWLMRKLLDPWHYKNVLEQTRPFHEGASKSWPLQNDGCFLGL